MVKSTCTLLVCLLEEAEEKGKRQVYKDTIIEMIKEGRKLMVSKERKGTKTVSDVGFPNSRGGGWQ